MTASDDRLAIVLLCTTVGKGRGGDLPIIGPVGWADISRRLAELGRPAGDLVGASNDLLQSDFGFSPEQAARIAGLVRRAGAVAIELERLADRGFWSMTQLDADYPERLREVLEQAAPAVLFGAGNRSILGSPSLAMVGSRDGDSEALGYTRSVAEAAVAGKITIASGGARGVDREASQAAIRAGGTSSVVVPEQLERRVRQPETREAIANDQLVVASPYAPSAGFSVRGAMGRNRIVYALAVAAIVVEAKAREGGTWAGAVEALKAGTVPVFVRATAKPWAKALLDLGARQLPWSGPPGALRLDDLRGEALVTFQKSPAQATLFDDGAVASSSGEPEAG